MKTRNKWHNLLVMRWVHLSIYPVVHKFTSGSFVIEQFLHEIDKGSFESEYELDDTTTIYNEAIGVVALITPWNWPMNQIVLKVIPALLVGCTVILKPSEQTPLSALLFAKLIHDAGFPKGLISAYYNIGCAYIIMVMA